jgi:hypothetical protein
MCRLLVYQEKLAKSKQVRELRKSNFPSSQKRPEKGQKNIYDNEWAVTFTFLNRRHKRTQGGSNGP